MTNKPDHSRRNWALALASAAVLTGGGMAASQPLTQPSAPPGAPFKIEEIADLDQPWAMTFLPDGRMLITEKVGQFLLLSADGKQRKTVAGAPAVASGKTPEARGVHLSAARIVPKMKPSTFRHNLPHNQGGGFWQSRECISRLATHFRLHGCTPLTALGGLSPGMSRMAPGSRTSQGRLGGRVRALVSGRGTAPAHGEALL